MRLEVLKALMSAKTVDLFQLKFYFIDHYFLNLVYMTELIANGMANLYHNGYLVLSLFQIMLIHLQQNTPQIYTHVHTKRYNYTNTHTNK